MRVYGIQPAAVELGATPFVAKGEDCDAPLAAGVEAQQPRPFDLDGIPQVTPRLSGRVLNRGEYRMLQTVIRRAKVEFRRRYELHNERVLEQLGAAEVGGDEDE